MNPFLGKIPSGACCWHPSDIRTYEMKDHLGNVRIVVSDLVNISVPGSGIISLASPEMKSWTDYYAYGYAMPGRKWNSGGYRFGFNGMERDDELKGSGNSYDYGVRIYDPRIAIWLKVYPRSADLPGYSPYAFAVGNPILYLDPDGEFPISIHVRSFAPFDYFGPGNLWKGDGSNRGFTTGSAGSRISMVTNYETETQVANSTAFGAMSFSRYGVYAYSDAYLNDGQRNVSSTGSNLNIHLYGKLEAAIPSSIPGAPSPGGRYSPTWDIDVHNNLPIDAGDGVLSISGQIRGGQFPSAEAFVTGPNGTSIFLDTAATAYGPAEGPTRQLPGDRDLPMIDVNVRIAVGDDGSFNGVYSQDANGNEVVMSPAAWNERHERKSTTNGE